MNTVTKVFIVINLLLAFACMYFVMNYYAMSEHWKRRWNRDTTEQAGIIKARDGQILFETFERTRAEQAADVAKQQYAVLDRQLRERENEINRLTQDLQGAEQLNKRTQEQVQTQLQRITSLEESLRQSRQRQSELNHIAQVARSVAFQLNVKLAEVEDDLNNAEADLTERRAILARLEQETKRKDAHLALVRDRHPEVWREITAGEPTTANIIMARVAAIRPDPQGRQDLVMLTVGRDDGVPPEGMEFIVYRGSQYIVKVRAVRVMGDMVACRVVPESWNNKGLEIQLGDSAQNRLLF